MNAFHLNSEDEDQLKELLNIGVSHASTKLAQMVGKHVTISVPTLAVKNQRELSVSVNNENEISIAVLLKLTGMLDGYTLLYFPYQAAERLLRSLSGKNVSDLRVLNEFDRSVFQEVGNVLTGGMLTGLSQFLHVEIEHSVPDVVVDMGAAMLNSIAAAMLSEHNEYLAIDISICVDATIGSVTCKEGEEAVGAMYLFLGPSSANAILKLTGDMIKHS